MTLRVERLSFAYGPAQVLDQVSLEVRQGTVTALFGPNGTGKSTLFRCVLGLLRSTGEVCIDGESTTGWSAPRMARKVAFVPQDHRATFPHTVRDMVTMGATAQGASLFGPSARDVARALEQLDLLGLLGLADRTFSSLSGGQRQLVLIARALAQDTDYLLFDEPTASLDFGNQLLIWRTIGTLAHERGKGVLVCSHDPNHVLWFCDEAVVLRRDGTAPEAGPARQVVTEATLQALYPEHPRVAMSGGVPIVVPATARS